MVEIPEPYIRRENVCPQCGMHLAENSKQVWAKDHASGGAFRMVQAYQCGSYYYQDRPYDRDGKWTLSKACIRIEELQNHIREMEEFIT